MSTYTGQETRSQVVAHFRAFGGCADASWQQREDSGEWVFDMLMHFAKQRRSIKDSSGCSVPTEDAVLMVAEFLLQPWRDSEVTRATHYADMIAHGAPELAERNGGHEASRVSSTVSDYLTRKGVSGDTAQVHSFLRIMIRTHALSTLNLLPIHSPDHRAKRKKEVTLVVSASLRPEDAMGREVFRQGLYGDSGMLLHRVSFSDDGLYTPNWDLIAGTTEQFSTAQRPTVEHPQESLAVIDCSAADEIIDKVCRDLDRRQHPAKAVRELAEWVSGRSVGTRAKNSPKEHTAFAERWAGFGLPVLDEAVAHNVCRLVNSARRNSGAAVNAATMTRYVGLVYIEAARFSTGDSTLFRRSRQRLLRDLDRRPTAWSHLSQELSKLGLGASAIDEVLSIADATRDITRAAGAVGAFAEQVATKPELLQDPNYFTTSTWKRSVGALHRNYGVGRVGAGMQVVEGIGANA